MSQIIEQLILDTLLIKEKEMLIGRKLSDEEKANLYGSVNSH